MKTISKEFKKFFFLEIIILYDFRVLKLQKKGPTVAEIRTHSRTSNFQVVPMFYAPNAFKVEQNAAANHENANFSTSTQK